MVNSSPQTPKEVFEAVFREEDPELDRSAQQGFEEIAESMEVGQTRALLVVALKLLNPSQQDMAAMCKTAANLADAFNQDVVSYMIPDNSEDVPGLREAFRNMAREITDDVVKTAMAVIRAAEIEETD